MPDIAAKGKNQGVAQQGTFRIEYDNDRIIYTNSNNVVTRIDTANYTSYFDPILGGEVMRIGLLDDGKYGVSWFDPANGREFMRVGILPNNVAGMAVARDGVNLPDAF